MTATPEFVALVPMPPEVWEAWRVESIARYAADMVRTGAWPPDGAVERASTLFARLVPDMQATGGHEFRSIVTGTGETVGALWLAAEGESGQGTVFIWDLVIDPAARGRGYGRAAMAALDRLALSLGYDAIRLHVFGDNEVARALYRSAGYEETDVTMLKKLGWRGRRKSGGSRPGTTGAIGRFVAADASATN